MYLLDSVESVLNQEYPSIECILVDDGSTDDTPELIKRWSRHARFRYIRTEHIGVSAARNIGIEHAHGDLIAFLDADDWWQPEKTMQQVLFLLSNTDLGFCWCDYKEVGLNLGIRKPLTDGIHESLTLARYVLLYGIPAGPPCWMVRRQHLIQVGGFDKDLYTGNDRELMFRLACNSDAGSIGKRLTTVRRRRDSISHNIDKKVPQGPIVVEKMLQYRPELFARYKSAAMHNLHRYLSSHTWMGQAWRLCILETLRAACWKPSYALTLEFWQNLLLAHVIRLVRGHTTRQNAETLL